MSIIVQKFGGTSVADAGKITAAARRAVAAQQAGHQVVMVVSARGKKTDELIGLADAITDQPSPREMDMLLSTGEQESVALMAMAVKQLGAEAVSLTGAQIGVRTDSSHTKARIRSIATDRMRSLLDQGAIVIAAGFQGVDDEFNITTLGRGGSDTTATALAAVLNADECQIYTDVEGVFSTDPRRVTEARKIDVVSYDEMLEMASLGAGVMHSRSIEFAKKYRVPLRVRPSYSDGEGTLVLPDSSDHTRVVTGVAMVRNEARVSLRSIPDRPGTMSRVFAKMSERKIPIDMVVQNVGVSGTADVSFTVLQDDLAETLTAADEALNELGAGHVNQGTNVSKVSVVGSGMRSHTGVAAQMFKVLADSEVNVGMVTTSEIKISVLVDRDDCDKAVAAVHSGFQLHETENMRPSVGTSRVAEAAAAATDRAEHERGVVSRLANMEDIVVSEVDLDDSQARITVVGMPDQPGVLSRLFSAVADGGVMVDMIVQNVAKDGRARVSFTIPQEEHDACVGIVDEVIKDWDGASVTSDNKIAQLSVTGIGLRSHTGVGEKMFAGLADAGINVQMINTSEIRITAVIDAASGQAALDCLNGVFELDAE